MDNIKQVLVEDNGIFKYIILEVQDLKTNTKKIFIRGRGDCEYHKDIKEKFMEELRH